MKKLFSQVNTTTLSGAMDIIVVEAKGGQLKSTPFYLAVSGTKLLKSRDKRVIIKINGEEKSLSMKLNSKGQGYFPKGEQKEHSDSCSQLSVSQDQDFGKAQSKKQEQKKQFCVEWVSKTNLSNQRLLNDNKEAKKGNKTVLQYVFGLFRAEKPLLPRVQPEVVHFKYSNQNTTIKEQEYQGEQNSLDPVIILSTCGNLINSSMKASEIKALFWAHRVQAAAFMEDPRSFLNNNALVVLINGVLYNWEVGVSVLVAQLAFDRFHKPMVDKLTESKNWFPWTRRAGMRIDFKEGEQAEYSSLKKPQAEEKERKFSIQSRGSKSSTTKSSSMPLRRNFIVVPTHDQLKSLQLKEGANKITYSIGEVILQAQIFLWQQESKVVVSDIDGTITKEDVLGQLYPIIEKSYIHKGVVSLFRRLSQLGYQIVYLTARSIGQSGLTKKFLQNLRDQEGMPLPPGPMFTSPEGIAAAFKKQVIQKTPEVIKIDILNSVRKLFRGAYPYAAGFGNRSSDFLAYQGVGLKADQIFIVDNESKVIRMNEVQTKTSYAEIEANAASLFGEANK